MCYVGLLIENDSNLEGWHQMLEEQVRKLKFIKGELREGTYNILQKAQWDEFSRELSNYGSTLLGDIEQKRDEIRKLKTPPLFFLGQKQLNKLSLEYNEIAINVDLFFDASMRWLKSIIDGNKYEEYQILSKQYVEKLVEHCRQASDYLGNLISAKRSDYYHYQALFFSVMAIIVATVSLIMGKIIK
jgi:hypothetical protein